MDVHYPRMCLVKTLLGKTLLDKNLMKEKKKYIISQYVIACLMKNLTRKIQWDKTIMKRKEVQNEFISWLNCKIRPPILSITLNRSPYFLIHYLSSPIFQQEPKRNLSLAQTRNTYSSMPSAIHPQTKRCVKPYTKTKSKDRHNLNPP